ncbi:MAG: hypothetical protein NC126_07615 [Clostridium sp.]|nr:hypothetical protein [Clostridium sp.]
MMKVAIKKIAKIVIRIIACCEIIVILGLCWYIMHPLIIGFFAPRSLKADDTISRTVCKVMDAKEFYYRGKSDNAAGNTTYYTFYINKEKKGSLEKAVEAINAVMEQNITSHKISVCFYRQFIRGAYEPLFSVCNYTDDYSSSANYEKLQALYILGTQHSSQESIYNDPETYKNFPDIRYLRVSPKIQKAADEAGIDWYEYWPDLETVEVYSSGD